MIHVTFSASGAGTLDQALEIKGRPAPVIPFDAELDWGLISPSGFAPREAWLKSNLPWDVDEAWDWIEEEAEDFVQDIASSDEHLVWIAPQSVKELCGLHWYLHLFGGERARFVVVDCEVPGRKGWFLPKHLDYLRVEHFQYLLENAEREAWDQCRFPRAHWGRLCDDATNLRITRNGIVTSVQEDYFDEAILASCGNNWKNKYYVFSDAWNYIGEGNFHIGVRFLTWRLRELSLSGKVIGNREIKIEVSEYSDGPLLVRLA